MRRRDLVSVLGGAAATWPLGARAQQRMPVVGFIGAGAADAPGSAINVGGLRLGLRDAGFDEGHNVTIEYRWAEGRFDRMSALAADLVGRKVDVIVAGADPAARAAKDATSTIPIVFIAGADPVRQGLVASLARPGGNLTGVSFLIIELNPKRFELLRELVPQAGVFALLVNPANPAFDVIIRDVETVARAKQVQLQILKAGTDSEIDAAFAALVERRAGALLVATDPFLGSRRDAILALAARNAVPAMYEFREYARAGGLVSYGANFAAIFRQVGAYAGRILKGAKPADLPVVQPSTFELVINLRTARALGLSIPPSILSRADEVIE